MCTTISSFTLGTEVRNRFHSLMRVARTIEIRTMTRTGRGNLYHFPLKAIDQIRCTRSSPRMAPSVNIPSSGRCWSLTEPEYRKLESAGRILFGADGTGVPGPYLYTLPHV